MDGWLVGQRPGRVRGRRTFRTVASGALGGRRSGGRWLIPGPVPAKKGGGNSGLLGGQVFAVDTGRSQGWELRVVVERGGPLEGRSARHLLAAGPLRFPFWMAYGICQGYEGTLASRMSLLFCRLLCLQL
jgi:hypothetical protein